MTLTAERPDPRTAAADFAAARRAMIDSQLRTSGVTDAATIEAMGRVPREDHVPAAARSNAYIDRAIALGNGHALPAPLFHGRMLSEAALLTSDRVLLVGCGSDYLAELVRPLVTALDVITAADAASRAKGKGKHSLILIEGAIEHLPTGLAAELAEGGRIVTGLVERGVTRFATGRKIGGTVTLLPLADMGIPILAEFAALKRWSF